MLLSIQYLRAIAAAMVVVYHILDLHLRWSGPIADMGQAGVDIFFVISGFIMWHTTQRVGAKPGAFLWKRITRVMPLYWLATLLMFSMLFVSSAMRQGREFGFLDLVASLLCFPLDGPIYMPVYFPGWTINYEMMFYVIFALCLFAHYRAWSGAALVLVLAALVGWGSAMELPPVLQWYTAPILLEFGAGVLIGMFYSRGTVLPREIGFGALLLGVATLTFGGELAEEGLTSWSRVAKWGVAASLIVFGAVVLDRSGLIKHWESMKLLGDASYSLYLSHIFTLNALAVLWGYAGLWTSDFNLAVYGVLAFLACFPVGVACYKYVERPLLALARGIGRRAPAEVPIANSGVEPVR